MTTPVPTAPTAAIERITVPAWAWALLPLAVGFLYLLLQDNGAVLAQYAHTVHEFTHDGRHALGVPCH